MSSLDQAANNILKVCIGLKKTESFLIMYDKNKTKIANILLKKSKSFCKVSNKIMIPIAKVNGEEPPKKASIELNKYDAAILLTTKSLSHTNARRSASKKGVRMASMPGATESMIKRTLTADYNKIQKTNNRIYKALKNKTKIKLTTKKGTCLTIFINKKLFDDNGLYHKKGDFGNLPAGEVGFAPIEGKTNGILVIDKTIAGVGKLKKPIKIEIINGIAKNISGKIEAKKLNKLLKNFNNKNVYNIAEFAIGTNYKAKITGSPLEDEKVFGTIHVALGDNTSYPGGKTKAPTHLDGIVSKPTIYVDNKKIMVDGKLFL